MFVHFFALTEPQVSCSVTSSAADNKLGPVMQGSSLDLVMILLMLNLG